MLKTLINKALDYFVGQGDTTPRSEAPTFEDHTQADPFMELGSWENFVMACVALRVQAAEKTSGLRITYEFVRECSQQYGGDFTSYRKIKEAFDSLEEKGFITRTIKGGANALDVKRVPSRPDRHFGLTRTQWLNLVERTRN